MECAHVPSEVLQGCLLLVIGRHEASSAQKVVDRLHRYWFLVHAGSAVPLASASSRPLRKMAIASSLLCWLLRTRLLTAIV